MPIYEEHEGDESSQNEGEPGGSQNANEPVVAAEDQTRNAIMDPLYR